MRNYASYTRDIFTSSHFSRNELNLFTVDFESRVIGISVSVLQQADKDKLTLLRANFQSDYGNLATKGAQQKGSTITKQDAYDDAIDFIKRKEGAVKSEFDKGSASYTEFYPMGITEYATSTVEGLKILLVRYVAAATKYKVKLVAAFLTSIIDIQTAYANARDEQVTGKSDNKTMQTISRSSRKDRTLHLTKCLLITAANILEDENTFLSYFNFGLLEVDNDNPLPPSIDPTKPL